MPNEETYQQQLNQERAIQWRVNKKTKTASGQEIAGVEFALIGLVGVAKDFVDWLDLGTVVGLFANIVCLPILWLWCLMRLHRFPTKRFIGAGIAEEIPFLDVLPFWTSFIVSVYLEQKGYLPKFLKRAAKPIPSK